MQKTYRKTERKKRTWKDNVGLGIYFVKNYWMIVFAPPALVALVIIFYGILTKLFLR